MSSLSLNKRLLQWLGVLGVLAIVACVWSLSAVSSSQVLFAGMTPEQKPLRLHILAASDDPHDQQIKLVVRDRVVDYLQPCLQDCTDKEEALTEIRRQLPLIEQVCDTALADQGADYRATAHLETADFPSIDYDGQTLAAGAYDALRITLGAGEGHNWWCVLFPPLCFVDLATEADEEAVVAAWSQDEIDGASEPGGYRIAWKLWPRSATPGF